MADDHGKKDDKHDQHGGQHGNEKKGGNPMQIPNWLKTPILGFITIMLAIYLGWPLLAGGMCDLFNGGPTCGIKERMWGASASNSYTGGYADGGGRVVTGNVILRPAGLRPPGSHRCTVNGVSGNCWN